MLEKQIINLNKKLNTSDISDTGTQSSLINDIKVVSKVLNAMPPKELKGLVDEIKKDIVTGIVIVISTLDKKASIVVGVTEDITNKYDAVEFTKAAAVSYTHLRAHETKANLVCRLLLEKKKKKRAKGVDGKKKKKK